jgi:hypothetical protein
MEKELLNHESTETQPQQNAEIEMQAAPAVLQDEQLQAKYRQAYLEQIRRQSCPGCGESGIFE